ncbi:MAG: hypothetical protein Q7S79_04235, partial [bacterium]|nr:hypothetical protein [bacterium]
MSEGEGIEPVLNKIRKRSEARREYEGRPTKFVDLLTRGLRDPGKLPTTEESASEEVLEQIEKKASRVREWLGKNGNRANEGISEDFKYRDFIGREEVYFEDLKNVRWLKEGVVDKDFILINSDFYPDQEGYDIDLQGSTGERSVIISLSS